MPAECPSRIVLNHVTSRWGFLVIVALAGRTLRWSELRREVEGVSEKMLAQSLDDLEADGLVLRTAYPEIPPRVEYALTDLGESLAGRILPLVEWLAEHAPAIVEGRA
jgi:DNA-binding HxlR family transcriptional regulator